MSKLTDEDAAYAAAAWASGVKQLEIARQFGRRTPAGICTAIGSFLERYGGLGLGEAFYNQRRKALVPIALLAFRIRRERRVLFNKSMIEEN